MTPAGIEPVTYRFVAQHLNHCATAVPRDARCQLKILQSERPSLSFIYFRLYSKRIQEYKTFYKWKQRGNIRITTPRCLCVTTVAVKKQNVLHITHVRVCTLSYPARKAHAQYYIVICGPSGSTVFCHTTSQMALFSEKKYVFLIFSTTSVCNTFHYKKKMVEISKMHIRIRVKYPLFLSDFDETWIFSTDFRKKKNTQISNFVKIRPVGADLFQADERTKLTVAFRSFENGTKTTNKRIIQNPTILC